MHPALPDHIDPVTHQILMKARGTLAAHYGTRLQHVVLFGSQARGDARADSDVDLLVVLDEPLDTAQEIRYLVDIELDLLDRYERNVHLLPFEASRYADATHPLMMHVHAEGLTL